MLNRLERARRLRDPIYAGGTNAVRIADGEGDGFGDLEIDDFDGRWLVQTRAGGLPAGIEAAPARSIYWKALGDQASPQWVAGEKVAEPFVAKENGLGYWIDFGAGYSQGIFLDQRDNRAALRAMAAGRTVLNCFAYTCAFGVAAAAGGGTTTNLDLSKRYLDWGRRNYALNGLDPEAHDFIFGDVFDWLRRFAKKGRTFDVAILDPPTFSRNAKGQVFRVERDLGELAALAAAVLAPDGRIFCSTNQRSLAPEDFRRLAVGRLSGKWRVQPAGMPPDFRGERYLKAAWLLPPRSA